MDFKTLGILGGGQLGRMSALAAARLGIKTHVYCPDADSPASHVAARTFTGEYNDKKKLKAFADSVDVITYEFENIPVETIRYLQKIKPVHPDDRVLEIAQDRGREKKFLNDIGIPTAGWALIDKTTEIETAAKTLGGQRFILKTTRFGYDGKGQSVYQSGDDPTVHWNSLRPDRLIIEQCIEFTSEISVIIARDKLGQTVLYGPIQNEHRNGILARSTAPAPLPPDMAEKAKDMARLLADAVDLIGVLTLEMFITSDGRILANEIAPRTHNSGHYSIDACAVSQFENHVRTVCAMPVGFPAQHSDAVMVNLIGRDVRQAKKFLEIKGACVHLYGKPDIREGRKLGHVTMLKSQQSKDMELPVLHHLSD